LRENLDALNEALGFNLVEAVTEKATENFSADLLATDTRLGTVVIENQYGKSDHDHLGKVLTYLSSLEADAAIWIVPEAREEHIRAIQYLNDETDQKYFLVRVSVIQVENSPVAPVFTLLAGPDEDLKARTEKKKEVAARGKDLLRFWEQFLDYIREDQNRSGLKHQNCTPTTSNWIVSGAGVGGIGYIYVVNQEDARVEVYFNMGDRDINKEAFDFLIANRKEVDRKFGCKLDWERLDNATASRIRFDLAGGYSNEIEWPSLFARMADAMRRLISAVAPEIEKYKVHRANSKKRDVA
jgi:hypothetical protein